MDPRDRRLGMDRRITRRDFLDGVRVGASALVLHQLAGIDAGRAEAASGADGDYPPALTGMRGNHPGSFEVAHALAWNGEKWDSPRDLADERYDLIVVGGGLSGLAAAWYFRAAHGAKARILILDNHDDFGGHAKRNEFSTGVQRLAWGGSVNLEYPKYSAETLELLAVLGVDLKRLGRSQDFDFASLGALRPHVYFDTGHYGRDVLVPRPDSAMLEDPPALAAWVASLPVSDASRR